LPPLQATAAVLGLSKQIDADMFNIFDKVFAGQSVPIHKYFGIPPYLVTKDNLPPKGYFFSYTGYKGRPPDFQVK